MSDNARLVREKLDQAVAILNELDIDAWMTFVRETMLTPDPSLELILGMDMVWQSAFIITRDNQRIAVVGLHDAENVHRTGGYTTIVPYVQSIRDDLLRVLLELNPRQLALNYSEDDVAADGLGHGLMLLLQNYLIDTDLSGRIISAERIIAALRGRKSPAEVERIRAAIRTTQDIFREVGNFVKVGMNEVEIAERMHNILKEKGLGSGWDWDYCPAISAGPDSPVGHGGPQAQYAVQPGTLLHIDFGVKQDSYCSDLQRIWYIRKDEHDTPPDKLKRAFDVVRGAIQAGFDALRPGVQGWQVDEAARKVVVEAGYPEYQYGTGHQLGRAAHDGATMLGPRWERYGKTPYGIVEAGNVYTLELGVAVEGIGYVGLEEDVLVTEDGAEWLSTPQDEIWLI
jgi:Xaa-Pro aminopeptidase